MKTIIDHNKANFGQGGTISGTENTPISTEKDYDIFGNEKVKIHSRRWFELKYGSFVQRTLSPQIWKKAGEKLSNIPISVILNHKDPEHEGIKKLNKNLNNLKIWNNITSIKYRLGYRASRDGKDVIVGNMDKNGKTSLFTPLFHITRVEPSTGKILYLLFGRYVVAGDLVAIITETRTPKNKTFKFFELDKGTSPATSNADFQSQLNSAKETSLKKLKDKAGKDSPFDDLDPADYKDSVNEDGFVFAVLIENFPDPDGTWKGQPDVDPNNEWSPLVNELKVRVHWELYFNKSKLLINSEFGTNFHGYADVTNDNIEENLVQRVNSPIYAGGEANPNIQYYETSNQNLENLKSILDYVLKKWWEHTGNHQSAVDAQGKNVTQFEAQLEREAETSRYVQKVNQIQYGYRRLMWMCISLWMERLDEDMKIKHDDIGIEDLDVNLQQYQTLNMTEYIDNEIKKYQANLTDRTSIKAALENKTPAEVKEIVDQILTKNNEDRKEEILSKPINVPNVSTSNPLGKENNQNKAFMKQDETNPNVTKGGKK